MPELPEMENYKILLNQKIAGQTITEVQINREKSINLNPVLFIKTCHHQKIIDINRRGKHLLFHLQNGQTLLLHLMLGGWIYYGTEADKPKRTVRKKLYQSIKTILQKGIQHGGYMDNPLFKDDKLTGGFNALYQVYHREGEKCNRCGSIIKMEKISSRKTFYCPICQT
ncbi:hypothetical protein M3610_24075 [Neobacillus sp. MER 74]|uniref:DNA-formamidopyrimidine glycosylase family protein n=1 Tax=Neobacillus sp. MER 74 TaxID=2939566 RepID=UPI00203F2CA0|nr:DNA-formamidopyrimidine glycosylase family protein [Neobacillus sp. MER 74]MCM3118307.1 hypothetical protein [Neobacillus sp. MER 74]